MIRKMPQIMGSNAPGVDEGNSLSGEQTLAAHALGRMLMAGVFASGSWEGERAVKDEFREQAKALTSAMEADDHKFREVALNAAMDFAEKVSRDYPRTIGHAREAVEQLGEVFFEPDHPVMVRAQNLKAKPQRGGSRRAPSGSLRGAVAGLD